jgi:hypothetical protein
MNSAAEQLAVTIASSEQKKSAGTVLVQNLTLASRLGRAAVRGFGFLCISILCIAIPILHFLLVPIGLLITVLVVISSFAVNKMILSGEGQCPSCLRPVTIYKRSFGFPFEDVCENCHRRLVISSNN